MRTKLTLGALLALALAGATAVAAASSSRDGSDRRVRVLHLTRDTGDDVILDLDHSATAAHPAPDSIGDEDVYTADLFARGTKVGIDGGVCKLVRLPSYYHCIATNKFADGDVTVAFLHDYGETGSGVFAITGGTGAYRGAGGEVTFVDHPAPRRDDVTFRLTLRP